VFTRLWSSETLLLASIQWVEASFGRIASSNNSTCRRFVLSHGFLQLFLHLKVPHIQSRGYLAPGTKYLYYPWGMGGGGGRREKQNIMKFCYHFCYTIDSKKVEFASWRYTQNKYTPHGISAQQYCGTRMQPFNFHRHCHPQTQGVADIVGFVILKRRSQWYK